MILFAEGLSDSWATAIAAIAVTAGLIAQIVLQIMAKIEAAKTAATAKNDAMRAQDSAFAAKGKVAELKEVLVDAIAVNDVKMDETLKAVGNVHAMVNGDMRQALESVASATRQLAKLSVGKRNEAETEAEADEAEKALKDHDARQVVVDAKEDVRQESLKKP